MAVVINTLLENIDNRKVRAVAFANDAAFMVSVEPYSGVSPGKTDLLLFTIKPVMSYYRIPSPNGRECDSKYLGVIPDPKIRQKPN